MPHEINPNGAYNATPSFYEILGLSIQLGDIEKISSQMIKSAYRQSLLLHHPDKAPTIQSPTSRETSTSQNTGAFSIDQITEAYNVLSTPKKRAQYDLDLRLQCSAKSHTQRTHKFKTGIETADLDDLSYDDVENVWYRSCRCGDERGFSIREADLEEVADEGELGVGCRGCSLWLKVLFGVADDGEEVTNMAEKSEREGG